MVGGSNGTISSKWNFDETIRGTMKGVQVQLDLQDLSEDEADEDEWAAGDADVLRRGLQDVHIGDVGEGWDDVGGTARATDAGVRAHARHPAVSFHLALWPMTAADASQSSDESLPLLDRSKRPSPSMEALPITPNFEPDDSVPSTVTPKSGKATWKERHDDTRGTIVREGDLGDGSVFPCS